MALSGSKTVNFFSSRYYLKYTWSATQSVTANTSTVTVKAYLGSNGSGYGMNASATKSGTLTINGTAYSFTKAGISLSSGGSVQIASKTVTINHNTDGTKSFAINLTFNPAVTVSGTSIGSQTTGSTTYTLNTIPRKSTISCNGNWTAGSNKSVTISRASSAFTHKVTLYVAGSQVAQRTNVGASTTVSFSTDENTKIFNYMKQGATASTTITVETFSGSTSLGSNSISGTVTAPTASTTTFTSNYTIGNAMSGTITSKHKSFTHTIELLKTDKSTVFKTMFTKKALGDALTQAWSYTPTASDCYALTPNSNKYTGYIRIYTYYNGVQVRTPNIGTVTYNVTNSNPTFTNAGVSYKDSNATTSAVTGNSLYLIQNKSNLYVTLASANLATAKNGATMKKYIAVCGNQSKEATHTAGANCVFDLGVINASTNQTLTIQAIDSRGNSTTVSKVVNFLAYSPPKVVVSCTRKDGFTVTVPTSVKGSYSPLRIGTTDKNSISEVTRSIKIDSGTAETAVKMTTTNSSGSYSVATHNYTVALTSVAEVTIVVKDKLSTVTTKTNISTGLPLFYVDSKMGSVSFNKLPSYKSTLESGLRIDLAPNEFFGDGNTSYGMNAMNSDIVGVNSIVFNDYSNNLGEGLRFPNSSYNLNGAETNHLTSVSQSPPHSMYTTVFFRNEEFWVDGGKFMQLSNSTKGTNNLNNNTLKFFAGSYIVNARDVDFSHDNGFVIKGSSDEYRLKMDANEMLWTNGTTPSPNYLQASTHNIQCMSVDGNNTTLGKIMLTSDSAGAYYQCLPVYNRTTTSTANVYVHTNGTMFRSTSSEKYKLDIVPAFDSIEDYKQLLNIEPVKWFDKDACEEYADTLTAEYYGEEIEEKAGITTLDRVYGCVAEQLEEVGLNCLVTYDEDGETTGVAYDRIPIMYIPLIKDLYNQVDELKKEIQTLKGEA